MCFDPNMPMQAAGKKPTGGAGARLDQAQRLSKAMTGGGTREKRPQADTILNGVPSNTDTDALRKITRLNV